ncbi:MAG TPA: hypothetical protein VGS41_16425, partial [Chthonomonadales bacterium]|nr:hypothetical protein [Chthonomonadales bacterium]
ELYLQSGNAAEGGALLRDYQKAQAASREYARISLLISSKPHDPEAHREMARYYLQSGNPLRAQVEAHRVVELNHGNPQDNALVREADRAAERS